MQSDLSERITKSMTLIIEDCEKDAMALDGVAMTGLAVSTNFGNLYAMVQAVARAVESLVKDAEV